MKFFCTTDFGNEWFLEKEFSKRFNITGSLIGNCLVFESNIETVVKIGYLAQSIKDIGFLLFYKENKDFDEDLIVKEISENSYIKQIPNLKKLDDFTIRVETNDNAIKSRAFEISNKLGDKIANKYQVTKNFKLAKRLFTLNVYKENDSYSYVFGLSLFNQDLSKRTYRVFVNKTALKPLTAFSLVLFSDLKKHQRIVDFLCKDNTLVLEAYHYLANRSVRRYDKTELINKASIEFDFNKVFNEVDDNEIDELNIFATDMAFPNIDAARKNAKIAGIAKKIHFSKKDLRFFDLSYDEKFDKALTYVSLSKYRKNTIVDKIKNFVLPMIKKDLNVITNIPEEFENAGLNILKQQEINQGELRLHMLKIVP